MKLSFELSLFRRNYFSKTINFPIFGVLVTTPKYITDKDLVKIGFFFNNVPYNLLSYYKAD